jgi:hypothetical protein
MTQSPLLGFNNNVKHRGRLFHIQTEDSGVRHPHVITHLFMDGGRILKTVKTSYAEHVGSDKLAQVVRDLMKEQHKMMFIALRDGQFDHVLDSVPPPSMSGPPVHPHGPFPAAPSRNAPVATLPPNTVLSTSVPAARPSSPTAPAKTPSATIPAVKPPSTAMPVAKAPSTTVPAVRSPSGTMPAPGSPAVRPPSGTMPTVQKPAVAPSAAAAPPATTARPHVSPSSAAMRAAASAEGTGPSTGVRPVPRREAPELFGAQTPEAAVVNVVGDQPAAAAGDAADGKSKEQPGSGRYAASRPAAIFASARNADAGGSIFGDDLISEKSLDEVILSYLSDDLDSSSSKK